MEMYCNPLPLPDIQCRMLKNLPTGDFREVSDPEVLYEDGVWYMYPSGGQAYVSRDCVHWEYHPIDIGGTKLGYAPSICRCRDRILLTASLLGAGHKASIWAGEIQAKVLQLPPKRVERIHFHLVREGLRDYEMNISIQPSSAEWKKDGVVTLTYGVPYVEKGKAALFVADDYIGVTTASRPVAEWTVSARPASPLRQARFVNAPHTMIELGGQRFSPIFWHTVTAVRSKKYHEFQMGFDYGFRNFRVMTDFHAFRGKKAVFCMAWIPKPKRRFYNHC